MLKREIAWRDPAEVFAAFASDPYCAWFDSQGPVDARSRYSMLAVRPFSVLVDEQGKCTLDGAVCEADAFSLLEETLRRYAVESVDADFPFTGGAAGFIGYEMGTVLEDVPRNRAGILNVPDMVVGFYDLVFGFDRAQERCWLFSSGLPEGETERRTVRAKARADEALGVLETRSTGNDAEPISLKWKRETSKTSHMAHVSRTLDYIAAGDIYQANIASRFLAAAPTQFRASDVHLTLRAKNPAPFGAFVGCGERLSLASVSPERFISLGADGTIETRPIKGTRPRGATPEEDRALRDELENSEKDRAENLMIVDLLRNDIGRAASFGSVTVPEFCRVESFAHVHHLVSAVRGMLRPGATAVDLLRACFPGGSITGAPKLRAMEIIMELEDAARGPYCGSVLWIGFDGAMDSNIAIRTLTVTPGTIAVQAGGGIVADSDPEEEYEEMMTKVRPLLLAFGDVPD